MMDSKKIIKMFELQNTLNNFTNGNNWKKGKTKLGNEINWIRCARFELAEAITQSFQWKHWKNNKINKQYKCIDKHNLKIELVDTYHFLMSELLKNNYLDYFPLKMLQNIIKKNINNSFNYLYNDFKKNKTDKEIILEIEELEYKLFEYEKTKNKNFENLNNLFKDFWNLSNSVLDFDEFYEIYVLKNVLNLFRQKNGYQEGTYCKNWGKDKIEDNVFLQDYINSNKIIEFDNIYDFLETNYKLLN